MKLAVQQPYIFPYIGYFELVARVDAFVFYDDINFIKNGWINRNRLLLSDRISYFTVPLSNSSAFQKINEVKIVKNDHWRRKMMESIRHSYKQAPYYSIVAELFHSVLQIETDLIADLAKASVREVTSYLKLSTRFVESSTVYRNTDLQGIERVIDICQRENANSYYNLPGGRALYHPSEFSEHAIALKFVDPILIKYKQRTELFHPWLSIIDVLMYNDPEKVTSMISGSVE